MVCQSTQALAFGGIALFLPLIRHDIGLTFTQAGTLAGAASLVYAFMQVPSGFLADRFGPRRLFLTGLVGANALSFTLSLLHAYPLLLLNQALSGFFRSLVFAPGMLLMTGHFRPDRRATALGVYIAGGFSSNIVLNSLGPVLVGHFGWRALFAAFSALGLLAVLCYGLLPDRIESPAPGDRAAPTLQPPVRLSELPRLLRHRVMWLTGVIQFVRLSVVIGLGFWLPTYLITDKGFSLRSAGLVVALGAAFTAPSNFLGGLLSDRTGRPLLVIGSSVAVLGGTLVLLVPAHARAVVVLLVAVNAVFLQTYFGPLFAVPLRTFGSRTAGVTSGFGNFCANLGGLTSGYTLGAVRDATGSFGAGLYAMAAMCVLALICTALLPSAIRAAAGPGVLPEPAADAEPGSQPDPTS